MDFIDKSTIVNKGRIEIETPYDFKGASCLSLYIDQVEGAHNQYTLSSEYECLFTNLSFEEVIKKYQKMKNGSYS